MPRFVFGHSNILPQVSDNDPKEQKAIVNSLVMTSRHLKLTEEYVGVAKVTVGPPLSWFIPKLFRNVEPLQNKESDHHDTGQKANLKGA